MAVIIDPATKQYCGVTPEWGIYQPFNPSNQQPWASEEEALAWQATVIASIKKEQVDAAKKQAAVELAEKKAIRKIVVEPNDGRILLGETFNVGVKIVDGLGKVVETVNEDFAVPIEDMNGNVLLYKLVVFNKGVATIAFTPEKSGRYFVTEKGINYGVPAERYLALEEQVELLVYVM